MTGNGRAWVWCQRSLRERGLGEELHMTFMDLGSGGPPEGLVVKSPDASDDDVPSVSLKTRDAQNHHGLRKSGEMEVMQWARWAQ